MSMPGSPRRRGVRFSGLGRGPSSGKASPKSSGHTPWSHSDAYPGFKPEGLLQAGGWGLGWWADETRAPLDRSEKTVRFLFPGLSHQRAGEAYGAGHRALSLERGVRTRSFGQEQGWGLRWGLQWELDLVLSC